MDSDNDIVRFEIYIPRSMRMQLAAIATRQRRSASAETVVAIARHIAAESHSVALTEVVPGSSSIRQGHNGVAAAVRHGRDSAGPDAPTPSPGAAGPPPECAAGSYDPAAPQPSSEASFSTSRAEACLNYSGHAAVDLGRDGVGPSVAAPPSSPPLIER
jgi:hypothetical protein